mgnify:CR=1 FL=1
MTAEKIKPETEEQLRDSIQWALGEESTLDVIGAGSKRALGRPVQAQHCLDLSGFSGVTLYQPEELVMTVKAATPLADIEAALAEHNQELAFEPANYEALLNGAPGANQPSGTIGGVIACNLSGPRRIKVGAARDHLLGFHAVSGRGDIFKSGGQVVKNVTGFDLSKLMAGSFGTLALITDVSLKVLPRPEKVRTLLVFGTDDRQALAAMTAALHSPFEVSGAAHVPQALSSHSTVSYVAEAARSVTAIRIEGVRPSVASRCESLKELLKPYGALEELHTANSNSFWQEIRDVVYYAGADHSQKQVWKISVPPASGAAVAAQLRQELAGDIYYDWGGGLLWLAIAPQEDAGQNIIRGALVDGGHATLIRADEAVRERVNVFQPQAKPLAALSARVKEAFDPKGILNPGRMVAGV